MNFETLEHRICEGPPKTVAVSGAAGEEIFEALRRAEERGMASFILTGREDLCRDMCRRFGITPEAVIPADSEEEEARLAVKAVSSGRAQLLMKGKTSTPVLLKALLGEKSLFAEGRLLSHLAVLENGEGRMIGITDGGMVPRPDLAQKALILENAVDFFHRLGVEAPKVAVLAANEKPEPKIPGSLDALELKNRAERGEFSGCVVDGPLSLDLAMVPNSALMKKYTGPIRGDADILLVHDVSAGNYLGKSLINPGGFSGGGLILGARIPVILLSRGDSVREKFLSILLALYGFHEEGRAA